MKNLILLSLLFSYGAHADVVTNSPLKSCIDNCVKIHSCKSPVKKVKAKKHAKQIPKKSIVKPVIVEEEKKPTKCEPVTEYVYLSNLNDDGKRSAQEVMQLPDMQGEHVEADIQSRDTPTHNSYPAFPLSPAAYAITNTRDVFVTNTKPYPIKHNRNEVTQTPLPASAWLFASGLAFLARRRAK